MDNDPETSRAMPPPKVLAELSAIVQFCRVNEPENVMPPPRPLVATFPLNVEFRIVVIAPTRRPPPPLTPDAEFPDTVQLLIRSMPLPSMLMPAPWTAELPEMVVLAIETVPPK